VGFDGPSAALVDPEQDVYLVSNVGGDPLAEDGNGFISRVTPGGEVEARFIEGGKKGVTLHAPRGMAVTHDTLVVADGTVLRLFDRRSGAPRGRLAVQGATLLDGIALGTDKKTLYVADRGAVTASADARGGAVFRVVDGKVTRVAAGPELGGPSALWPEAGGTWVVGQHSGELYFLGNSGKRERVHAVAANGLQGLIKTRDGLLLLSSAAGSAILQGQPGQAFSPLLEGVLAPGNLAYDKKRHRLVVPLIEDDVLVLHRLEELNDAQR
jgi:DNA-binding beta-propeller fold protein YncE